MDKNFKLIGGGISGITPGSIGATASWILGAVICAAIIYAIYNGRRSAQALQLPAAADVGGVFPRHRGLRPRPRRDLAGEFLLLAQGRRGSLRAGHGHRQCRRKASTSPSATRFPVLIAWASGIGMTFLATRTRFGRYVYAIGRQSGSGRTRRHQHQEADGDDLRADGRAGGHLGRRSPRPASTRPPMRWASSTSST